MSYHNDPYQIDYLMIYPCLKERPDVLEVLKKSDRKMKYMEVDLKSEQRRKNAAALNKDRTLGRRWRREAIDYILQNERYAGNALLQKRYTPDSFPRKKKRNRGEREMYFVSGSNEAIISQEMFDQAQQLRKTRKREPTLLHDTISRQIRCSCGAQLWPTRIA